jgi:hypothetical protein
MTRERLETLEKLAQHMTVWAPEFRELVCEILALRAQLDAERHDHFLVVSKLVDENANLRKRLWGE